MFNSGSSNTSSHSNIRSLLTPPPIQSDPKRQSQMLMESKRRSLAIKDTDLLEQMLRGDLEGFHHRQQPPQLHQQDIYQPSEDEDDSREDILDLDEEDDDSQSTTSSSIAAAETKRNSTIMLIEKQDDLNKGINEKNISCLTCDGFPCTFPCDHSLNNNNSKTNDPFALFTGVAIALGIASQLGITDDWTVPITLATLVSSFLWNGSKNKTKTSKTL